jgi:hypothetical protein
LSSSWPRPTRRSRRYVVPAAAPSSLAPRGWLAARKARGPDSLALTPSRLGFLSFCFALLLRNGFSSKDGPRASPSTRYVPCLESVAAAATTQPAGRGAEAFASRPPDLTPRASLLVALARSLSRCGPRSFAHSRAISPAGKGNERSRAARGRLQPGARNGTMRERLWGVTPDFLSLCDADYVARLACLCCELLFSASCCSSSRGGPRARASTRYVPRVIRSSRETVAAFPAKRCPPRPSLSHLLVCSGFSRLQGKGMRDHENFEQLVAASNPALETVRCSFGWCPCVLDVCIRRC